MLNPVFFALQSATAAARVRLGDKSIGTRVRDGLVQIVRVSRAAGDNTIVTPITGYLPTDKAIRALEAL